MPETTRTPSSPPQGQPRSSGTGARALRVLQVLGGAADPASGVTGVERVVQTLVEGLDATRFEHYLAYPNTGALAGSFALHARAVLASQPRRRWDRAWVAELEAFLQQHAIDLVVSHGMRYDFLCALACRRSRTPHLVSRAAPLADEATMGPLRKLLYGLVDTWTLHRCTGILTVSEASKRRMQATQGLASQRLQVIPNGVRPPVVDDGARRAARAALGVGPAELLVGAAGRLVQGKGFDVLVATVASAAPDVALVLLGEGPERPRLEAQARRLGVRLFLPGFLPNPYPTLAACDVGVLPSRAEGMPLAVLEFMALGVPTIASRGGGTGEVVVDGESGLLVAPGDAVELARALRHLLESPPARQRLGEAGAARVRTHFGVEALLRGFETALARVLAASRYEGRSPAPKAVGGAP